MSYTGLTRDGWSVGLGSPGRMNRGTCPTGHGNASSRRGGAGDRRLWISGPRDRREFVARSGGDEALACGERPGVVGEGGEVPGRVSAVEPEALGTA